MKGQISISRFNGDRSGISIELMDETSRVRVVRIELTPEQLGNAITGLSSQDCEFELGRVGVVGMRAEYKQEIVPFDGWTRNVEVKKAAVAPFEVDGWKADLDDLGNHHRQTSSPKGYRVGFRRHVKP